MINPAHINEIIRNTLSVLDLKELAIIKLIKGTFLVNSGLTELYDNSNRINPKFGLMAMPKDVADYTLFSYIKYKPALVRIVNEMTGFDLRDPYYDKHQEDKNEIFNELNTNIKFMVLVTFAYYDSKEINLENDSLDNMSKIWKKFGDFHEINNVDVFIERYHEIFINT